jgi:hypothetical protein
MGDAVHEVPAPYEKTYAKSHIRFEGSGWKLCDRALIPSADARGWRGDRHPVISVRALVD